MRSVFLFGGLAVGVALLVLNGHLPRQAGAAGEPREVGADRVAPLEIEYTDYAAEQRLVRDRAPTSTTRPTSQRSERRADSRLRRPGAGVDDPPSPDEPPAGGSDRPSIDQVSPPVADAGTGHVVWVGAKELPLDGGRSSGDELEYSWRQVSGPHQLIIKDPNAAQTVATGLRDAAEVSPDDAEYEFELTVTDACGQQAADSVRFTVRTTPDFAVRPSPKRQVVLRDGYLIAHLEAWKTNRTSNAATFELRSGSELYIHHYTGDATYDVTVSESGGEYVYQITVYYQDGHPTTWLELFVDTPERVPAILQLGVNWE